MWRQVVRARRCLRVYRVETASRGGHRVLCSLSGQYGVLYNQSALTIERTQTVGGSPRDSRPEASSWAAVEVLAEPTRRDVFDTVRAARGPVTREDVARQLGLQRTLVAFHLDRLAEAGLLNVSYARPPGRTGPGAGRPAKQYDAREVSVDVAVPPRKHALVGSLLARAIAERPGRADTRAREIAADQGRLIGERRRRPGRLNAAAPLDAVTESLNELGYEPQGDERNVRLRNCPFHDVMQAAPELVCAMNLALVEGVLTGLGGSRQVRAVFEPTPGECCVRVTARRQPVRGSSR